MVTVGQIYDFIDSFAPFRNQDSFDNSGLCVGSREMQVSRVLLALDATNRVVEEAKELGCELILTHHPVIFDAMKHLDESFPAARAMRYGIACIGAHTSLDCAEYGVSDMMVDILGMVNLHTDVMVECVDSVTGRPVGYGALARCEKTSAEQLARLAGEKFGSAGLKYVDGGRLGKEIEIVACGSGACSEILQDAHRLGAQALITADVKYSRFLEAERIGMTLIDAGHYETEAISLRYLAKRLGEELGVECVVSRADCVVKGVK